MSKFFKLSSPPSKLRGSGILVLLCLNASSIANTSTPNNRCLIEVLSEVLDDAPGLNRKNPYYVNEKNLRMNQQVVLAPELLNAIGFNETSSARMKVINVVEMPSTDPKGNIYHLQNASGKRVEVTASQLQGQIFRKEGFQLLAPFEKGEFVQIHQDSLRKPAGKAAAINASHDTVNDQYMIGKFHSVANENYYEVELQTEANGSDRKIHSVPKDAVIGTSTGTAQRVFDITKPTTQIKLYFEIGEKIRYRDRLGNMHIGEVGPQGVKNGAAHILDLNTGKTLFVPETEVFRRLLEGNDVKTPYYKFDFKNTKTKAPEGALREFLNGGARITSHSEFQEFNSVSKLLILTKYVDRFVPWSSSGRYAERSGLSDFNKLICAGVGVCRHNSTLLASLLQESGFHTRMAVAISEGKGHAWIEVIIKNRRGIPETWIVDPSASGPSYFIHTSTETAQMAKDDPKSFAARYYTNTERKFYSSDPAVDESGNSP